MLKLQGRPGMAEGWRSQRAAKARGREGGMGDSSNLDDSLTSLQWLQDFSITNASLGKSSSCPSGPEPHNYHQIPGFAAPCSPLAADPACMGMPHTPSKPTSSSTSRTAHPAVGMQPPAEDIDYKTNPHVKPPYSYATLICMAMEASKKSKITLSDIYKWITDNFCYFRHADPTWQNSIRHNLSLNKCFIKVPREKGEPGKGGFWKIDPQYADRLMNGTFKKRRMPPVQIHPASTSRAQQEVRCVASPATSTCTNSNVLNVNVESQQLLKEFEEVTGDQNWNSGDGKAGQKRKQPMPKRTAKSARLSSPALLTQEEQTELGSLKGDFDWEAIFDTNLNGDFSAFEGLELSPPISPIRHDVDLTVPGQHIDRPQEWCTAGQEQVLSESGQNNLDFDETFMATSFLQHPWDEGKNDYLSNSVSVEKLFELSDASLTADVNDWSNVGSFL
ncbi:forkhead box protein J1 [Oxyura jamaicensis]|uniref:forkhead box protein J1 n=1 Tax=Oxyura jamaicensis TaxID=8884 RepID=UPI0015A5AFD0|nr:forkhead box protein J1 [Oxyura jamaicensis]XP_035198003.1 forkhead box protein J1 [Oxyura jamaicensis]